MFLKHFLFISLLFSLSFAVPTSDIIRGWGYPCEDHNATTTDGWNLSLQRIPHGIKNTVATKGVVFFQHGLADTSVGACLNPPNEALPFILADNGYDVWLGNNRGNGYSMSNNHFTPKQPGFWNFTWDDMAQYDLPANINYILSVTKQNQLYYIGHSEGTTQAFAGFLDAKLASKVKLFVALAPVAYIGNMKSEIMVALSELRADEIEMLFGALDFHVPEAIHMLFPDLCFLDPSLCDQVFDLLFGPSLNLNNSRLSYYVTYEPNPTSTKNIAHWAQGVRSGAFCKYDYGYQGNMRQYGQPTPPEYKLQNFPKNLPVALFTGSNDVLADPQDAALLLSQLPGTAYVHNEPSYAHMDFLWSPDAKEKIYPLILKLLQTYA